MIENNFSSARMEDIYEKYMYISFSLHFSCPDNRSAFILAVRIRVVLRYICRKYLRKIFI